MNHETARYIYKTIKDIEQLSYNVLTIPGIENLQEKDRFILKMCSFCLKEVSEEMSKVECLYGWGEQPVSQLGEQTDWVQKYRSLMLICEERMEQIHKHGFDSHNDKLNNNGELIQAAQYALVGDSWPSLWRREMAVKIDAKSHIGKLKVAGALIAAEIDRLLKENPDADTN